MGAYEIRDALVVVVHDGGGHDTVLGVFFDDDAVGRFRERGDCRVVEAPVLTVGGKSFILRTRREFVADAGLDLRGATIERLSHRQRRVLGLEHDAELAAKEPLSWLGQRDDARERKRLLALVLTEPEAEALGLREEQERVWAEIMEGEQRRMDARRAEIDAHPLIGRVFRAASNSKWRDDDVRTHLYVVQAFDEGTGKYEVHKHGEYACLTPGAFNERLLYSAEEIEAGSVTDTDYGLSKRGTYEYDDEGRPYVPHERQVHARIV